MSLGLTDSQYYSDIADAIREKTGSAAVLAPSEMSAAIGEISGTASVSLINEAVWIATDATHRAKTPIDANNYIKKTGNTITLHRDNSAYGLVVRLPDLQANHTYLFIVDSITNSDNYFYVGQVTSLTSTTMTDTRIMAVDNRNTALKITPSTSGDYSVMLWMGAVTDISITSPILYDLDDYSGITPDSCLFFNEYIVLPFTLNSNHKVYIDYEYRGYVNDMQILGNTAGNPQNFYHGMYNYNLYVYTDNGERNFSNSTWKGRHVLIVNDNGRVTYDGEDKFAGAPNTNSNINYTIGYRGSGVQFFGYVYRFYIYDTVNDEYICDLVPTWDNRNNRAALKDIINNVIYTPSEWV